jgi:CMP-N-acetylneuraminic acid synthetase
MRKRILGIIPARGGSKGIPNKNLLKIGRYNLVERALFTGLGSNVIDRIIVSSDSNEIIDEVNKYGDFAPFVRPNRLASDEASSLSVMKHAIEWVEKNENKEYNLIVLIEPPCPFRLNIHLDLAVDIANDTNATSVMSLVEVGDYHPVRMKKIEANGSVISYYQDEPEGLRRQDQNPVYIRNGAVYVFRREILMEGKQWGTNPYPFIMDRQLYSINIDDPLDFLTAKAFYDNMRSQNKLNLIEYLIPEAFN